MALPDISVIRFLQTGWQYVGMEERNDYDASGNVLYSGMAQDGSPTDAQAWIIAKFYYDATNQFVERIRFSRPNQVWDQRASLFI